MSVYNNIKVKCRNYRNTPNYINIYYTYTICEDFRGIYLTNGNRIYDFDLAEIKKLFYPINTTWLEIERGIKQFDYNYVC